MKGLHKLTFILLVIGGINWLLLGLFNWEIGHIFGGMDAVVSRIIYILVGLSAIVELVGHKKSCKGCCGKSCDMEEKKDGSNAGGGVNDVNNQTMGDNNPA